jgi:hypothetical protein
MSLGGVLDVVKLHTREAYQEHHDRAFPLLGEVIPFRAHEREVFGGPLMETFAPEKSKPGMLRLRYMPPDDMCPRVRVELEGLEPDEAYSFWQAFHQC